MLILFWGLVVVATVQRLAHGSCLDGCTRVETWPGAPWLLLLGNAGAVAMLVALVKGLDRLFLGLCLGGVAVVFGCVAVVVQLNTACDLCTSIWIAMIGLSLTNIEWKRLGAVLGAAFGCLSVYSLVQPALEPHYALATPTFRPYEQPLGRHEQAYVVMMCPGVPDCRTLEGRIAKLDISRGRVLYRWSLVPAHAPGCREAALAVEAMMDLDPAKGAAYRRRVLLSQAPLTADQLAQMARDLGGEAQVRSAVAAPPAELVRRLEGDARIVATMGLKRVPMVLQLFQSMPGTHGSAREKQPKPTLIYARILDFLREYERESDGRSPAGASYSEVAR